MKTLFAFYHKFDYNIHATSKVGIYEWKIKQQKITSIQLKQKNKLK